MGLQGKINENHIPNNSFELVVTGLPVLTLTKIDDIEESLEVVTMPDRTKRSGGQTTPVEFTGAVPMHHDVEVAALEAWYKSGQSPVQAGYRKAGTLVYYRNDGTARPFSFTNLFVSGRNVAGADMENEGEMSIITYTFQADDIMPI